MSVRSCVSMIVWEFVNDFWCCFQTSHFKYPVCAQAATICHQQCATMVRRPYLGSSAVPVASKVRMIFEYCAKLGSTSARVEKEHRVLILIVSTGGNKMIFVYRLLACSAWDFLTAIFQQMLAGMRDQCRRSAERTGRTGRIADRFRRAWCCSSVCCPV